MINKNNTLYLECYSGISGDMLVGALLDLGAEEAVLLAALGSLPLEGYRVQISRVKKNGLEVCDFAVLLDKEHDNHDHDMEYLHGEGQHVHGGEHSHSGHGHRSLQDILTILGESRISDSAKELAGRIFHILAEAEAKAHGTTMEEVHFHEVGAVDSIVDIAAIAVCMDNLAVEDVIVPCLYEGSGYVRCQHGMIPVPVPAVVNIAGQYGIRLHMTGIQGELVTPTGAAAVAALAGRNTLPESFAIRRTGMGAGKRQYERPSLLRAMLIEETEGMSKEEGVWKLESNIDDCSGEALGFCMERLLGAGARDVHYSPVFMKKNRPAYQLNVICAEADIPAMERIIFEETTTIGIRRCRMERTVLPRRIDTVSTPFGEMRVKVCRLPGGEERAYPEYEDIVSKCREYHFSYREIYDTVLFQYRKERQEKEEQHGNI